MSTTSNLVRDMFGISRIDMLKGIQCSPCSRSCPGFLQKQTSWTGVMKSHQKEGMTTSLEMIFGDVTWLILPNSQGYRRFQADSGQHHCGSKHPVEHSRIWYRSLFVWKQHHYLNCCNNGRLQCSDKVDSFLSQQSNVPYSVSSSFIGRYDLLLFHLKDVIPYNITVGCDNITTNYALNAFITGDTLTRVGRTFLRPSLSWWNTRTNARCSASTNCKFQLLLDAWSNK